MILTISSRRVLNEFEGIEVAHRKSPGMSQDPRGPKQPLHLPNGRRVTGKFFAILSRLFRRTVSNAARVQAVKVTEAARSL